MKDIQEVTPFYKRLSFNLLNLVLLGIILYLGQGILIPFFFAILLSVLLLPVVLYFRKLKFNKFFSILVTLVLALSVISAIIYFLSHQILIFLDDLDNIQDRLTSLYYTWQHWVKHEFDITITKQNQYVRETGDNMDKAKLVGRTVVSLTAFLSYVVFLPIYAFLILYYKDLIKQFLIATFDSKHEMNVREIVYESRIISQRYIAGLMIDMSIVFALYATGFEVLGIKYALFLALVAALLNLMPYIGMIIACLFCTLITLVSTVNVDQVIWIPVIILGVHFIDNNFLLPMIVGSKVKINPLVTLLGVLSGGAICGIPGMFLSIPGMAVLKVIFDRVEGLKPFGMMMGDGISKSTEALTDAEINNT